MLELGAGSTGCLGLALAACGAKEVVITDRSRVMPSLLSNVMRNARRVGGRVRCEVLEWHADGELPEWARRGRAALSDTDVVQESLSFDVLVGCDCAYDASLREFEATARALLRAHPRAVLLLTNESSLAFARLQRRLRRDSFRLETVAGFAIASRAPELALRDDGFGFEAALVHRDIALRAREELLARLRAAKQAPLGAGLLGANRSPGRYFDVKINPEETPALAAVALGLAQEAQRIGEHVFGTTSDLKCCEVGGVVAEPGAERRPWRADTSPSQLFLLTLFAALGDISEADGPTLCVRATHDDPAFAELARATPGGRGLASFAVDAAKGVYAATLRAGDCCLLDSRVFRAGGAHAGIAPRCLLYMSVRDGRRPAPEGSTYTALAGLADVPLGDLIDRLCG